MNEQEKNQPSQKGKIIEATYISLSPLSIKGRKLLNLIGAILIILFNLVILIVLPLWMISGGHMFNWLLLWYYTLMIPLSIILLGYLPYWKGYIYMDERVIRFRQWGFFTPIYSRLIELSIESQFKIIYNVRSNGLWFYRDNKRFGPLYLSGLNKEDLDTLLKLLKENKNVSLVIQSDSKKMNR